MWRCGETVIRFSKDNWEKFETHNKKTTIRFGKVKVGFHTAGHGSMQWGSWSSYPEKVYVHPFMKSCKAKNLTEKDAKKDGFDTLNELMFELGKLNPRRSAEETVYVYPIEKVKILPRKRSRR